MLKKDITFPDFQKLDFRVGKVLKAETVVGSLNLLRLEVDLGSDYGVRQILSGVAKWYQPQELKSKKFIFVANLAAKKIMGLESCGMIFAADVDGQAVLIPVKDKTIPAGTVVR